MKTGDKNQAAILSVVAVLAIGFLAFQLVPKGKSPLASPHPQASTKPASAADSETLPLTVIGNPFSHSKLATKPVAHEQPSKPAAISTEIDKHGTMPLDPSAFLGEGSGGPEESAGGSRYVVQAPRVTLTGLMRVDQPLAMLAVENKEPRAFAVGDLVAKNARLISIGDGTVTIRVNGKERVLAMGETLGAKKEQTQ